ncbi:hypothetical protein AgCh_026485 [Apium graveolens]
MSERELAQLSQTPTEGERASQWVLNAPEPPGLWRELVNSTKEIVLSNANKSNEHSKSKRVVSVLESVFPILVWSRKYTANKFRKDLMAGLTLASLCIPQSIGYATLAKLAPQHGLYTNVVPPIIYAFMGSSREIAIGPVAVVSLLISSMVQKLQDPEADPIAYRNLVFTVTLYAGIFQAAFGLLRLGFLVDFLSHAVIVGFMAGAAIIIGLQQLKGLLGITYSTNKTDIVSVLAAVFKSLFHNPWSPYNFVLGCSFLCFLLLMRIVGRRNKKLFWLPAIAPLVSVVLSTLIVYLPRADKHGVTIVKHIKSGLNPISIHQLQINDPHATELVKIGAIVAVVALTEAIAVGRSFATIKGYHLDGNKEMLSMGVMNIAGSLSSCYVATGSFSRTAVNFSAGCETVVSNIVMVITVIISLEALTRLLYFTPIAILASIIISALPGLIDVHEAYNIYKVDKLDFLALTGAFFGVLFGSVEIGLLVAVTFSNKVAMSFAKIIISSIQPGIETLGKVPGTDMFCDVNQYPMAVMLPGVLSVRIKSPLLCFANATFIRERISKWAIEKEEMDAKGIVTTKGTIQLVILDMSNLTNIDTTGLATLEELYEQLLSQGIMLAITNPKWQVVHKLKVSNLVKKIEGRVFLTIGEAADACLGHRMHV